MDALNPTTTVTPAQAWRMGHSAGLAGSRREWCAVILDRKGIGADAELKSRYADGWNAAQANGLNAVCTCTNPDCQV